MGVHVSSCGMPCSALVTEAANPMFSCFYLMYTQCAAHSILETCCPIRLCFPTGRSSPSMSVTPMTYCKCGLLCRRSQIFLRLAILVYWLLMVICAPLQPHTIPPATQTSCYPQGPACIRPADNQRRREPAFPLNPPPPPLPALLMRGSDQIVFLAACGRWHHVRCPLVCHYHFVLQYGVVSCLD